MKLLQLEHRIRELESLAEEVADLAKKQGTAGTVEPNLKAKGQRWYRGAREILVQQNSSALAEFELLYHSYLQWVLEGSVLVLGSRPSHDEFAVALSNARSLLVAVTEEIKSRELPVRTQLSSAVSADELDRASELLGSSAGDEAILRAAGVVARVAIERHLWTTVEAHGIPVQKNPPNKKAGYPGPANRASQGKRHNTHLEVRAGQSIRCRYQLCASEGAGCQGRCGKANKARPRVGLGDSLKGGAHRA